MSSRVTRDIRFRSGFGGARDLERELGGVREGLPWLETDGLPWLETDGLPREIDGLVNEREASDGGSSLPSCSKIVSCLFMEVCLTADLNSARGSVSERKEGER